MKRRAPTVPPGYMRLVDWATQHDIEGDAVVDLLKDGLPHRRLSTGDVIVVNEAATRFLLERRDRERAALWNPSGRFNKASGIARSLDSAKRFVERLRLAGYVKCIPAWEEAIRQWEAEINEGQ